MIIKSKLSDSKLLELIYKAASEYQKLLNKTYLIVGKNKKSGYFWFQCSFEKKQFMHLLGIKSKTLSADVFFNKCIDVNSGIAINDCTPSRNHNRTTINEKVSCCTDILNISDAKYMKVGIKDKLSQYVDFKYAYGNTATLGFQIAESDIAFPITLIPKDIDEFSSQKYKIMYVFQKTTNRELYNTPMMEIKNGLFVEHYEYFPAELKAMIVNPAINGS